MLVKSGGIMSSNINEVNVKGLIREDGYYRLTNIPELFCEIAEDAGKELINRIMQKFLDGKLSKDLKIDCPELKSWVSIPNSEPIIVNVNDYKRLLKKYNIFNQKWESIVQAINDNPKSEFYNTPYTDPKKIMIHVDDIIQVLKDYRLEKIGKKISSSLGKKISKKILKPERDLEIIRLYQEAKKQLPNSGDHEIAKKIKEHVKKSQRKRGNIIKINQEIGTLELKSIVDIISDYYSNLIKQRYEEYWFYNETKVQQIFNGIESKEKDSEFKISISLKTSNVKSYSFLTKNGRIINNTYFYESNKEFIDGLYKRHGTKPTVEQVIEVLDEEFIKFTAKEVDRPEYSVRSIVFNLREKKQLIEIKQLTTGEQLLDKVTRYIDVFGRDDLKQAVKCIPDKEVQERLVEEALADKSVQKLNKKYDPSIINGNKNEVMIGEDLINNNSEVNEPTKYIRITYTHITE